MLVWMPVNNTLHPCYFSSFGTFALRNVYHSNNVEVFWFWKESIIFLLKAQDMFLRGKINKEIYVHNNMYFPCRRRTVTGRATTSYDLCRCVVDGKFCWGRRSQWASLFFFYSFFFFFFFLFIIIIFII